MQNKQYFWNILGTLTSTAVSVLLLMIASRLLDAPKADLFSISFTVAQQLLVIALFGVRPYQSTDVSEKHQFGDYFYARLMTIALMIVAMFAYLLWTKADENRFLVITLLTLFRGVEALSDVFQGYFQQHHRSDLAGKILFYRSLVTILGFAVILWYSNNLVLACLGILIANILLTFFLDYRYLSKKIFLELKLAFNWMQVKHVLLFCFSIFINTFLINYVFNEPRLVIDRLLILRQLENGLQRDFNVLFMPTFVLNLILLILRPLLTELADDWQKQRKKRFNTVLRKIALFLLGLEIVVLIMGYFLGIPVLSLIFGLDLSDYQIPLFVLLLGAGFNLFSILIDNILVIKRRQHYLIIANIIAFVSIKLLAFPLIKQYSLLGAAISFLLTMFIYFLSSVIIYMFVSKKGTDHEDSTYYPSL